MSSVDSSLYLGIDYGPRKIGIAVGQTHTQTTQGISTLKVGSQGQHLEQFKQILHEWRPCGLVIGLPLDSTGGETDMSRKARCFGDLLHKKTGLPVYWVNEHLTSQEAHSYLLQTLSPGQKFSRKKQAKRDQLAAELILRSYFESQFTQR